MKVLQSEIEQGLYVLHEKSTKNDPRWHVNDEIVQ